MKDYLNIDGTGQATFKVSETPRIDHLIRERKYDEALSEINQLLKTTHTSDNLNLKGTILDKMSEFDKAIATFDEALEITRSDEILKNKAEAYYNWAKVTFFPAEDYEKAITLIDSGIEALPESEDASEYYFLKAEIFEGMNELVEAHKYYLKAYKEFDKLDEFQSQTDYLKSTNDTLINIVGCDFYNYVPKIGDIISLIKDEENEHDPDAVAVVIDGDVKGYVANSSYTLIDEVKSASVIKNIIGDEQKAEILFVYLGEYVIAKLIK